MSILAFIVILSVLIIVHEFGHFIAARQAGVKVEKFAIGFGPPLLKIKGKETDFMICLFPLGGYVKMAGDARSECRGADNEFLSKPVGIKMRIVFAGPLFNYLFAFVIFWVIAMMGFPYPATVIGEILPDYPAYSAGLKEGDRVLEVNEAGVETWYDMAERIYESKEKVILKIERNGEEIVTEVPLRNKEVVDGFGRKKNVSVIGISASSEVKIVKYNFFKALVKGAEGLINLTLIIIKGFVLIIAGVIPFKEAVGGPIAIYDFTSRAVEAGAMAVLSLMAALNVTLAIINLFPVPILDGGHIFLFSLEKLRKKPLSEKTEDVLSRIGLALLLTLMVFVFYNDIAKKIRVNKNNEQPVSELKIDKEE